MDYGYWSGKKLDVLRKEKAWKRIQKNPSSFTFPNGESFKSLKRRLDDSLSDVMHEKGPLLFVTHGDVIKMALALVAGIKIDNFQKFVVEPGSISVLGLDAQKSSILASNTFSARGSGKYWSLSQLGGGDLLKRSRFFRTK
jgi:probable phosphoglycerate mutase